MAKNASHKSKDNDGWTPLHHAASEGQTDIVNCLLENGASKFEMDKNGKTALNLAEEKGHSEIVKLLARTEN